MTGDDCEEMLNLGRFVKIGKSLSHRKMQM